jgi:DivIVA domain-containing protein
VSPLDGRPARTLLDTSDVREPVADIVQALARHGGDRFTDARTAGPAPGPQSSPQFEVVLRGYDRQTADELIDRSHDALASPDPLVRGAARERIDGHTLTVILRGYDRGQVDAYLLRLSGALTTAAG